MTTDYKNLSLFEVSAVVMIAVGIALVGVQFYISLPDSTQAKISGAFQVLEMSDAVLETWSTVDAVNSVAFGGMEDFMNEFYVAIGETAMPIADSVEQTAAKYTAVANAFMSASDNVAANYQNNYANNYAAPGVEAGMGGRVMGAYFEQLLGQ